jgi:hypothetical protein
MRSIAGIFRPTQIGDFFPQTGVDAEFQAWDNMILNDQLAHDYS